MRDEIYRFGIVLYNKQGLASPVHWIGDIRMPSNKDSGYKFLLPMKLVIMGLIYQLLLNHLVLNLK